MSPPPVPTVDRRTPKERGRWDSLIPSTRSGARGQRRPSPPEEEDAAILALQYRRLVETCREHVKAVSLETTTDHPLFSSEHSDLVHLMDFLSEHYDRLPVDATVPIVIPELFSTILQWPRVDARLVSRLLPKLLPPLSSPRYAAALLLGGADHTPPRTSQLLHGLQQWLPQSADCLAAVLLILSASDSTAKPSRTNARRALHHDLDMVRLQSYWIAQLDAAMAMTSSRDAGGAEEATSALQLLRCTLQCAPQICSSHTFVPALLFPQYCSTTQVPRGPVCHCVTATTASLLQVWHGDRAPFVGVAGDCLVLFLRHTPWSLWLGHSSTHGAVGKRSPLPRSSFQQNLCDLLHDIIRIAACKLRRRNGDDLDDIEDIAPSMPSLWQAIFMNIPYHCSSGARSSLDYGYEESAVDLVDQLMIGSARSTGRTVLIECVRGCPTPAGVLAHTAVPVEQWLRHRKGRVWVRDLLVWFLKENGTSTVGTSLLSKNVSLLCAILGSYPSILLDQESLDESDGNTCVENQNDTWPLFQRFTNQFSANDPVFAARCIEKLLHGRQCYMKSQIEWHQRELLEFCVPMMERWILQDPCDSAVATLAMSGFASLFPQDWDTIPFLACPVDVKRLIRQMIALCTSASRSDSFRSSSCKAMGSFCTNFIASRFCNGASDLDNNGTIRLEFCVDVLSSMKYILVNDNSSSVQCMAMFVIGNLSHSIVQSLHAASLPYDDSLACGLSQELELIHAVTALCLLSISKDHAKNEKLVTNAVRTTGYMTVLMVDLQKRGAQLSGLELIISEDSIQQLVQRVLHTYTQNIRTAIELGSSSDDDPAQNRWSWKQRSGIKKQGWGSCNALSFLFENNLWIDSFGSDTSDSIVFYQEATSCLVECLENLNMVHEKIVVSACVALRSIPDLTLLESNVLSRSLVACTMILFDEGSEFTTGIQRQQMQKLHTEVAGFLFRLVSHVSIPQLHLALQVPAFCSCLDDLYCWMIQHTSLPGHTYHCFAVAISNAAANVSVQVEEQFQCQAQSYSSRVQLDVSEEL
jgi:hypothetical protein